MNEVQIPKPNLSADIPTNETLQLPVGSTTIIAGANGTGKTRLAVYIEEQLGEKAHRISAHRALNLNPDVDKIPENKAKDYLLYGNSGEWVNVNYRKSERWKNKSSTCLLNDFDRLLQYLFAQQNNLAVANHQKINKGLKITESKTKFDQLQEAWEALLPHRKLHISADDIQVSVTNGELQSRYSASEMSDGERAIFYILGQVLSANKNTILIFDEPELHIHKSIIANLWDKIEELRPDCAFLMITHDIEFASTRVAEKYVIRNYYSNPAWDIYKVPNSNFDEQTITMILGSRKPILFVEGTNNSLDIATYRACYPAWTIIPKGSCQAVIQAVSSFNHLAEAMPLLNLQCKGIVDNDTRSEQEISKLNELGIYTLPVSEIENIFSLTDVARVILTLEGYPNQDLDNKIADFQENLLNFIKSELSDNKLDSFIMKQIQRKIDSYLKNIDLSSLQTSEKMQSQLSSKVSELTTSEIPQWISEMKSRINICFENNNLDELLTIYENKGLLAKSSSLLRNTNRSAFENWLIRQLNCQNNQLIQVIMQKLPSL